LIAQWPIPNVIDISLPGGLTAQKSQKKQAFGAIGGHIYRAFKCWGDIAERAFMPHPVGCIGPFQWRCLMGLTYDVLKIKVKSEGKFTLDELMWMVDKMKEMDRTLDSVKKTTEERLSRIESKDDDHIPGGI
jgi:hypothetical protein